MNLDEKLLYTFRGWIAFVAFMDLGTAVRSFMEKRYFLGDIQDRTLHFVSGITMVALIYLPKRLLEPTIVVEEENAELLKQASALRKRRLKK